MLFAGLRSVRMVKNCDLGLKNAALGLRPRAAFSRPRSQFFTIRTSQPANNIYISLTCEDIDVVMVTDMSANNIRASLKSFKLSLTFFLTQKIVG